MNTIRGILENMGYTIPSQKVYSEIETWKDWYKGYCEDFHSYSQYNGTKFVSRIRKSLRMAKKVCEDHANLLMNEKVKISVNDEIKQEFLDKALKDNNFRVYANWLTEISFALGQGSFVEHPDGSDGVIIDYVRSDMIFPLSWEGREITECAFASIKMINGKQMYYINIHKLDENQNYVIYNKLFPVDGGDEFTADEKGLLPGNVLSVIQTNSQTPRFQFIYPNIVNNIEFDSPLGISVFANAIDVLKAIDDIYDSYDNEFRLGKKRIFINGALTKIVVNPASGEPVQVFDDRDTEFYALPELDSSNEMIHEIDLNIRAQEHEIGLQRNLNLLSDKCGLGNDRYEFNRDSVKTATEVISEKSDMYQNLKKNELVFESALTNMVKAILEIGGYDIENLEVIIDFDDSIITDRQKEYAEQLQLLNSGIISKAELRAWYFGETIEDAAKNLPQSDTMLFGDGNA